MEIGKMISRLRNEKGLNQRELANLLGVSNGAIGMWETGKRQPDLDTVKKIAIYFGVSADYLLGLSSGAIHCPGIAKRIAELSSNSAKESDSLPLLLKTEILSGYCNNPDAFMQDVHQIADFFEVTDEYILGGKEFEAQTDYSLSEEDKKFLSVFHNLNQDNKDIILGDMKKYLKEQRYESVAAEEAPLREAK